ncbi:MAG: helix-turn-helix transcriptional regulator [candidate division WOR-3 bacterium]
MAEKLKALRRKANLKQPEVADLLGLKSKYGRSFIAPLENGPIRNPSLRTVLDYLRICGASWIESFKELDAIDWGSQGTRCRQSLTT